MTAQPIPFEVSAPAKHLPDGMRKAILRGLSKEREQRPSTAREFFTELSDGGRMTVEANPAETAAAARTGTAAMDAVPAFAAGAAQAAAYGPPPAHPAPTPMAHAAAAPIPPAPARGTAGGSGGGKGLIFGLVGVGAVLLGAILILVVRSNKPQNDDLPPIAINTTPSGTAASTGPVEIKPLETPPSEPPVATGGSASPSAGGTSATPAETGKPATTPGTGKPAGTPPAPKGDPCDACQAAAASGNASGVNASLSRCTDAGKQAQCKALLGRTAVGAVKQAALNGQCDRAKALVAAADAAGVKGAARGLTGSSCK
jgi:hypothetical protein